LFPKNAPSGSSLALLLVALWCTPFAARAGEAEKTTVRPTLDVEQAWDSNVFNLGETTLFYESSGSICGDLPSGNQISCNSDYDSLVTYIRPGIQIENAGERGHARLQLGASSRTVWIDSEMNGIDTSALFDIERALTPRFSFLTSGSYIDIDGHDNVFKHDPSSSDVPLQPLSAQVPDATRDNLLAGFRYQLFPRTQMALTGSAGRLNFERLHPELNPSFRTCLEEGTCSSRASILNSDAGQYRDLDLTAATLAFTHRLSAFDELSLSFDYDGTEYQDLGAGERDTHITSASLTWGHDWTYIWSSSISIGGRLLDTSDDDVPSVGTAVCLGPFGFTFECTQPLGTESTSDTGLGVIGAVSLQGTFARSSVRLSYSRDTRSTGGTFATDFDIDSFSLEYVDRLAERVTLRLNADYSFYNSVSDEIAPYPSRPLSADPCTFGGTPTVVAPPQPGQFLGASQCVGGSVAEERTYWTLRARLDWQIRKRLTAFGSVLYFAPDSERSLGSGPKVTTADYDKFVLGVGMRYAWDLDL
jgi:hypothetical protein